MYVLRTKTAVTSIGRRGFLGAAAGALAAAVSACLSSRSEPAGRQEDPEAMARRQARARLLARPASGPGGSTRPGPQPLGLGSERDGVIYVPPGYDPVRAVPLVVSLHGAGGSARRALPRLQALADQHNLLLLAVDSRDRTWDVVIGGYGRDVAFIDSALTLVFSRYNVDPGWVAVEGFSDGASYALGLGLSNGDLFTHILAFSPGFLSVVDEEGAPRIFISHGTDDPVLPIDQCSRRIVPALRERRYDVRYVEFDGGHVTPPAAALEAVEWFLGRSA